jgi:hypothetical protein
MALMLMLCRPKRANTLPDDARPPLHAVADHGDDRLIGPLVEGRQMMLQLEAELVAHRLSAAPGVGVADREADGVLGGGLRDQDHVDPG